MTKWAVISTRDGEAVSVYSDALNKLHARHPDAGYWISCITARLLDAMIAAGL